MGEVYRARDAKLNRDVAIKVLLPAVANDPDRLARFSREAQVLASLNHPNIAHIYGLDRQDGREGQDANATMFLVMELVEGEELAQRIARGPLGVGDALAIAKQIAEALEAAHERGIVHRDLKPANIKVRDDGTVKVLDFGLAKATDPGGASSAEPTKAPTIAVHATQAGIILGTAAYMSPEQASGKAVDKRSDLWAFGVVLMEMLTGRRVFDGETVSHVVAAVLTTDPDWAALPPNTPASIRTLLRRCLERDRKYRIDSAAAARLEIDDAMTLRPADTRPAGRARRIGVLPLAFVLAAGALAAVLATWALWRPAPPAAPPPMRFTMTMPPSLPLTLGGTDHDLALAPDGSFLVYRSGSRGQLVVRRLDRLDGAPLTGVVNARWPFVSPDSRWIGYVENNTTLNKIAVSGGSPIVVAHLPGLTFGATWVDDATIVAATFNTTTGLLRVPAAGGEPTVLTTVDQAHGEVGHWFPESLPGGRALLFTIAAAKPEDQQIAVLDLQTGQRRTLLRGGHDAQYVASGHLVYGAGSGLSAVRFDLARLTVVGDPVRVVEGLEATSIGAVNAAVTRTGTLVYVPGGAGGTTLRSLVWVDRQGRETPIPAPPRAYVSPRLSPDGTRVALEIRDQEQDIWTWDLARQTLTRLTFDPAIDLAPVWTPDGRRIVFASTRSGAPNLFVRPADGTGMDVRLTTSKNRQATTSVTPDGAFVVGYEVRPPQKNALIARFALDGGASGRGARTPVAEGFADTPFEGIGGEISPDGHFLAYESFESGRPEIFVRPYPQTANGRWEVSTEGGSRPAWTSGGRELIYLDGANRLTAVAVESTGPTFHVGTPAALLTTTYATPAPWRSYDVSPDGQRFLMIKEGAGTDTAPPSFVVVQNWFGELKRLVPAK